MAGRVFFSKIFILLALCWIAGCCGDIRSNGYKTQSKKGSHEGELPADSAATTKATPPDPGPVCDYSFFKKRGLLWIAHRGNSGTYPEGIRMAYESATLLGMDYIECDVVLTKDHKPICSHDSNLDYTTDASTNPYFNGKSSTYYMYGDEPVEGHYALDFTFDEIAQLAAKQRYDFRFQFFRRFPKPLILLEDYLCVGIKYNALQEQKRQYLYAMSGQSYTWEDLPFTRLIMSKLGKSERICNHLYPPYAEGPNAWVRSARPCDLTNYTMDIGKECGFPLLDINRWNVFEYFSPQKLKRYGLLHEKENVRKLFMLSNEDMNRIIELSPGPDDVENYDFLNKMEFLPYLCNTVQDGPIKSVGFYIEPKYNGWHQYMTGMDINRVILKTLSYLEMLDLPPSSLFIESFEKSDVVFFQRHTHFCVTQLLFYYEPDIMNALTFNDIPPRSHTMRKEYSAIESLSFSNESITWPDNPDDFDVGYYDYDPNRPNTLMLFPFFITRERDPLPDAVGVEKYALRHWDPISRLHVDWTGFEDFVYRYRVMVHVYTFRNEYMFLPVARDNDPYYEMLDFSDKADAMFVDQCSSAHFFMVTWYVANFSVFENSGKNLKDAEHCTAIPMA